MNNIDTGKPTSNNELPQDHPACGSLIKQPQGHPACGNLIERGHDLGLCILPSTFEKKPNADKYGYWKHFTSRFPTTDEIQQWVSRQPTFCGIVCGKISGGLLVFDFDVKEVVDAWKVFERFQSLLQDQQPDLWRKFVIESTPSGGHHVVVRCKEPGHNERLVTKVGIDGKKIRPLVETRAEGGFCVCAPSEGYVPIQNDLGSIPTLSEEDLAAIYGVILQVCCEFDYDWAPDRDKIVSSDSFTTSTPSGAQSNTLSGTSTTSTASGSLSPLADFNQRGDVLALLKKHDWCVVSTSASGAVQLRRPGKNEGSSATYNY